MSEGEAKLKVKHLRCGLVGAWIFITASVIYITYSELHDGRYLTTFLIGGMIWTLVITGWRNILFGRQIEVAGLVHRLHDAQLSFLEIEQADCATPVQKELRQGVCEGEMFGALWRLEEMELSGRALLRADARLKLLLQSETLRFSPKMRRHIERVHTILKQRLHKADEPLQSRVT